MCQLFLWHNLYSGDIYSFVLSKVWLKLATFAPSKSNNFSTYLYSDPDLICALAKSEDGQNILKRYSNFYPKKLLNESLVPGIIKEDVLLNARDNPSVVVDQFLQDMVINPAKITNAIEIYG